LPAATITADSRKPAASFDASLRSVDVHDDGESKADEPHGRARRFTVTGNFKRPTERRRLERLFASSRVQPTRSCASTRPCARSV
jgi:hypothetical protein